jgi:hypothetical protein
MSDSEKLEKIIAMLKMRYQHIKELYMDAEAQFEKVKNGDTVDRILDEGMAHASMDCYEVEAKFIAEYLEVVGVEIG